MNKGSRVKKWLLRGSLGVVASVALFIGAITWISHRLETRNGIADAYPAPCDQGDAACAAWRTFRTAHPYPYQTIAAKSLGDGTVALVVSEPPPGIGSPQLDALTHAIFGDDLRAVSRKHWGLGADGWLEDLVLTIHTTAAEDPLSDATTRDRLALLAQGLYGTSYGADVEPIGVTPDDKTAVPPLDFHVTPNEVSAWLSDPSETWVPIDDAGAPGLGWQALARAGSSGAFISQDGRLVMLTFPVSTLAAGLLGGVDVSGLRVPFRQFSIASDVFFAGVKEKDQLALIGRARTASLWRLPPLRFETFTLLAREGGDELAQSYERNTVFAGKLHDPAELGKDWAPIYLSPSLVDTEFGALLNTTDQLLKSWSSAGEIEYLYFNYPKPGKFPFSGKSLPEVVFDKTGSGEVLFNWNTSGSAVQMTEGDRTLVTVNRTGALPVTYGADGKPKDQGGADLLQYEEEAYRYFAELGDPNLSRVLQYTVMYQFLRATAPKADSSILGGLFKSRLPALGQGLELTPKTTFGLRGWRRLKDLANPVAQPSRVIATAVAHLIEQIDAGTLKNDSQQLSPAMDAVKAFQQANPSIDTPRIAALLADQQELMRFLQPRVDALKQGHAALRAKALVAEQHPEQQEALLPELVEQKKALDEQRDDLQHFQDSIEKLGRALSYIAGKTADLGAIRTSYMQASEREVKGAIRTPSIVTSWDSHHTMTAVGGHNIDARALRFVQADDVDGIEIVPDAQGRAVLRYDAAHADAVRAHAGELARAVEHEGVMESEALGRIAGEPAQVRSAAVALGQPAGEPVAIGTSPGFGRIGGRGYAGKKAFVDEMRGLAAQNDCCVFVARDDNQLAYVTEINLKPPPLAIALEFRDTPSLTAQLVLLSKRAGRPDERAVIFLDAPPDHVQGLLRSMKSGPEDVSDLISLAEGLRSGAGNNERNVSAIVQRDLSGTPSWLRALGDTTRELLGHAGMVRPREVWANAEMEVVDGAPLEGLLQKAAWDKGRDGLPTAIKVSFEPVAPYRSSSVSMVAGFDEQSLPEGSEALVDANRQARALALSRGASAAQYLTTVRAQLAGLPPDRLKRLLLIVEEDEARALFTRLSRPPGEAHLG